MDLTKKTCSICQNGTNGNDACREASEETPPHDRARTGVQAWIDTKRGNIVFFRLFSRFSIDILLFAQYLTAFLCGDPGF